MKSRQGEEKRLLGLRMLQRVLDFQLTEDTQFTQFQPRLLRLKRLGGEERMEAEVRNSCCSFEGTPYQGPRSLVG